MYEGHKVYFLTHSMGSLVVEYWFKNFREMDCATMAMTDNSDWLDVGEIIMLGAPLYGAPAALSAFASGANLTEGQFFGAALRPFDHASSQLTEHGPTFVSMYQLLPIYRDTCFRSEKQREGMLYLRADNSTASSIDDIFSAQTWRNLGWPVRLPAYLSREEYYETFLPKTLTAARNFQCELAGYDLGAEVSVTYFYGVVDGLTTPTAIEVRKTGETTQVEFNCSAAPNNCLEQGDGTVPAFIAKNAFSTDRRASRSTALAHMDLLRSKEVAEYVASIIADTQFAAATEAAAGSTETKALLAEVGAMLGRFVPMTNRDPALSAEAVALNREIMAELNMTAGDISLLASIESDVPTLLQWTTLLSALPEAEPESVFYNLNKAALFAKNDGDYSLAIDAWDAAIEAAIQGPGVDDKSLADIYLLRGSTFESMADPESAFANYKAADELGNPAGQLGIDALGLPRSFVNDLIRF